MPGTSARALNVVLVVLDTLRRDHLGCYGNPWIRTPNFDRLAQMGVTFENAYIASTPCLPARREIWTGRYEFPWRGWGPLEDDDVDIAQALGQAGRLTMLVTDHYHLFERGAGNYHFHFSGWEFIRGQENDHWETDPSLPIRYPSPPWEKLHRRWEQYWRNTARNRAPDGRWRRERDTFAARTFQAAIDWLDAHRQARGFFLLIDAFDPHEPFDPPAPYDTLYHSPLAPPPERPDQLAGRIPWPIYGPASRYTPDELADIRALYAGEVSLVDAWLGRLLDKLEQLGRLRDTAVIVTTDHGYLFGEHGMLGKPSVQHGDSNLYQPLAHIPLLLYHPDGPRGLRLRQLVQPVDLLPTVLELMGVGPGQLPRAFPGSRPLHGRSLLPLLAEPDRPHRTLAAYGKFGEALNVTDGRYTLFLWPPGDENRLFWYSTRRPQFLLPAETAPFDRERLRLPVAYPRGPCQTALYDLAEDDGQTRDLVRERPDVLARLRQAAREWLQEVGAPAELVDRYGL